MSYINRVFASTVDGVKNFAGSNVEELKVVACEDQVVARRNTRPSLLGRGVASESSDAVALQSNV